MATYAFLRDKVATDKYTHLSADWCEKYNILDSDVELLHDAIAKDYYGSSSSINTNDILIKQLNNFH